MKRFTIYEIVKAWDEAYFEDLREEAEGFLDLLNEKFGSDMRVERRQSPLSADRATSKKSRPKRKQSRKQKLLTTMTAKKWKTYSKGSGRKTYVEIRSQVSRSKAYKSKAKKL